MEYPAGQNVAFQLGRVAYWFGDSSNKKSEKNPGIPRDLESRLSTMGGVGVNFLDGVAQEALEQGGKKGLDDTIQTYIFMEKIGKLDSTRLHNLRSLYYQRAALMLENDSSWMGFQEIVSDLEKSGIEKEKIDVILVEKFDLSVFLDGEIRYSNGMAIDGFSSKFFDYLGKEKTKSIVIKAVGKYIKERYDYNTLNFVNSRYFLNKAGLNFSDLPENIRNLFINKLDKVLDCIQESNSLCLAHYGYMLDIYKEKLYEFTNREFPIGKMEDAFVKAVDREISNASRNIWLIDGAFSLYALYKEKLREFISVEIPNDKMKSELRKAIYGHLRESIKHGFLEVSQFRYKDCACEVSRYIREAKEFGVIDTNLEKLQELLRTGIKTSYRWAPWWNEIIEPDQMMGFPVEWRVTPEARKQIEKLARKITKDYFSPLTT